MSEQLIDLLKLGLLALLYLFFLRVIWAVWSELRAPATEVAGPTRARRRADDPPARARTPDPVKRGRKPRRGALRALRVIEPAASAGIEHPLLPEMTLGRAPGCTVVVDDTYASQLHCRVFADGDSHRVEDLGSTNGTLLNGRAVSGPEPLTAGDRVQVGNAVFEVVR